jgi:hypothetical protein
LLLETPQIRRRVKIENHWITTEKPGGMTSILWRAEEIRDQAGNPVLKITCTTSAIRMPGTRGTQLLNHQIIELIRVSKHGPRLRPGVIASGETTFFSPFALEGDFTLGTGLSCLEHQDWWNHITPEEVRPFITSFHTVPGPNGMDCNATMLLKGIVTWEQLNEIDPLSNNTSWIASVYPEKTKIEPLFRKSTGFDDTEWNDFPYKNTTHTPEIIREILPLWIKSAKEKETAGRSEEENILSEEELKDWLRHILDYELGAYPESTDAEAIQRQNELIEIFNDISLFVFTAVNLQPPLTWFAQSPKTWQILTRSDRGKLIANSMSGLWTSSGRLWADLLTDTARKKTLRKDATQLRKNQRGYSATNPHYRRVLERALSQFGGPNQKAGLAGGITWTKDWPSNTLPPKEEDVLILGSAINGLLPLRWAKNPKDIELLCDYHKLRTPLAEAISLSIEFTMEFLKNAEAQFKSRKLVRDLKNIVAEMI